MQSHSLQRNSATAEFCARCPARLREGLRDLHSQLKSKTCALFELHVTYQVTHTKSYKQLQTPNGLNSIISIAAWHLLREGNFSALGRACQAANQQISGQ